MLLLSGKVLSVVVTLFCNFSNLKFFKMGHTEKSSSKLSKEDLARLVVDYQGKFNLVLKTVKNNICELKTKFRALKSEFHISFFFYLDFLSRTFTINRTAGEGGGYLFNSSVPFLPASQYTLSGQLLQKADLYT